MSSSAYSNLFVGVVLKVEVEYLERTFKRFNPKNGTPELHTGEVVDARIFWGDKTIELPQSKETFQEARSDGCYSKYDHFSKSVRQRVFDFLTAHGCDEEIDHQFGYKFGHITTENGRQNCDVGISVAHGSSYGNALIEINEERIQNIKDEFFVESESLANAFGLDIEDINPSLYLRTSLC